MPLPWRTSRTKRNRPPFPGPVSRPSRKARGAVLLILGLIFLIGGIDSLRAQDLEEQIALCTSCHGEDGRPIEPDIPIIWGQEFYYLYVQLKDYKAGRRANEVMEEIASGMEKAEMQALAQHFSEQTWPGLSYRADDETIARGQSGAAVGQCPQCHLGSYFGNSRVPRLAGQAVGYLERTMLEFKHKARLNSPAKGSLMAAYEDADIAAMAHFLAGL